MRNKIIIILLIISSVLAGVKVPPAEAQIPPAFWTVPQTNKAYIFAGAWVGASNYRFYMQRGDGQRSRRHYFTIIGGNECLSLNPNENNLSNCLPSAAEEPNVIMPNEREQHRIRMEIPAGGFATETLTFCRGLEQENADCFPAGDGVTFVVSNLSSCATDGSSSYTLTVEADCSGSSCGTTTTHTRQGTFNTCSFPTPTPVATNTPVPSPTSVATATPIPSVTLAPSATPTTGGPTNTPIPPTPTGTVLFCHQNASITLPDVTPIPSGTPAVSTTPAVAEVTIQFTLKFQGVDRANIATEENKTQKIRVTVARQLADPLQDIGLQTILTKTYTDIPITVTGADAAGIALWQGEVPLTGITAGENYSVYIKGPKHLQRKFCQNNPTEQVEAGFPYRCLGTGTISFTQGINTLDFSGVLLQAGDLPSESGQQDGIINAYDVSSIVNILRDGENRNEVPLSIADIDLNGVVNAKDRSYLIETLEEKYGDEE